MFKYERCIQMIQVARKRLSPSDASYARKIQELSRLECAAREAQLEADRARRARVDPLAKLPLELLVEICKIAIDDMDVERPSHFAVVLGSVCRSLRELVHQTPYFWQSLALSDRFLARKSAFWLDRLAERPLYSLNLVDIGLASLPRLKSFLAATRPASWKHLRIQGSDGGAYEVYKIVQTLEMRLHSFSVVCPPQVSETTSIGVYDPNTILEHIAPASESQPPGYCMRGISLHVGTIKMSCAALTHITHLELCMNKLVSSQSEPLFYVLRAVPNLHSLVLRPHNVFANNQHPDLPILPDLQNTPVLRLESLQVLRIGTIGPLQSLTTLQFPNLQVLDLAQLPNTKPPAILLGYLVDASPDDRPPIREIRLTRVAIRPPLLKRVLETFSDTLESLEVSSCSALDQDVLESLSRPTPTNNLLCPRLCDVNFSGTDELRAGSLVRLIKARLEGAPGSPRAIRNVIVDACPNIDAEALPWIRANVTGTLSCVYKTRVEAKARRRDRYI